MHYIKKGETYMVSQSVLRIWLLTVGISIIQCRQLCADDCLDLKTMISHITPLRSDGKIAIPDDVKHIKLDIGLSYDAPISQYWLSHEQDLIVFGFEPNPASVNSLLYGPRQHRRKLEKKFIGKNFFLIPCALGLSSNRNITFYVTSNDCGCSSIYEPKDLPIERIIEVPIFSLKDFFDLFPFDTHPVIEYIKIDAQGSDLDIAKSAGSYLAERVIYITLEAENTHYRGTVNSCQDIDTYMHSIGFIPHKSCQTNDPTYFNTRYAEYVKQHSIQIYQR